MLSRSSGGPIKTSGPPFKPNLPRISRKRFNSPPPPLTLLDRRDANDRCRLFPGHHSSLRFSEFVGCDNRSRYRALRIVPAFVINSFIFYNFEKCCQFGFSRFSEVEVVVRGAGVRGSEHKTSGGEHKIGRGAGHEHKSA